MSLETCAKCRGCCSSVKIAIKKDSEAGKLFLEKFENDKLPEGHELSDDENNRPGNWFYNSNKEECMFLESETYACTINDTKPVMCSTYPLKWSNQHNYYIDLCALSFVIPLIDIFSWKDGLEDNIKNLILYTDAAPHSRRNNYSGLEEMIPISRMIYERESVKRVFKNED